MKSTKIKIQFKGPGLHSITEKVTQTLEEMFKNPEVSSSGILHLFNLHTSSALTINESWDDTAKGDLERFLEHLAPQNLPFIQHVLEGPDDSPAHMKTALLNQHIALIVENGKILLGRWQGIFLAEFREHSLERSILCKYQPDVL